MTNIREPKETPSLRVNDVVFTSGSTTTINAPVEKVFGTITDFKNYHEWNPWCPKLEFTDSPVVVGSQGTLYCHMEAQNRDYEIPVTILELTRDANRSVLIWRGGFLPRWAAIAERVQEVVPGPEAGTSVVTQWESMGGWAAYGLKYILKVPAQLDKSNVDYVLALKKHCEKSG